ncbi:hypothetical protein HK104_010069 [Borealophlyctis nickersoniae]|nr:hypothetical protein HK104_010069 [Borealophlyctis nickersoniae]
MTVKHLTHLLLLLLSTAAFAQRTPQEWKSRRIYQVFPDRFARSDGSGSPCQNLRDNCGGTWDGLTKNLDYIADMGFNAIWISPITDNTQGGYHGYWPRDIYKLNENFGTEKELKDLVKAAHSKDIYIMLDCPVQLTNPFNRSELFHELCIIQEGPETQGRVELCRLGSGDLSLPDLNTENPDVVKTLYDWTDTTVKSYTLDGIRIDAAKHIRKDFYPPLLQRLNNTFSVGEIYNSDPVYVADYQRYIHSAQHYPLYDAIRASFNQKSPFRYLETNRTLFLRTFPDPKLMVTFVDNHDTARFLQTGLEEEQPPLTTKGTEQAYTSLYNQDAHYSRNSLWQSGYDRSHPMYRWIKLVNGVRALGGQGFVESNHTTLVVRDDVLAFQKGDAIAIVTNGGSQMAATEVSIPVTSFAEGTVFTSIGSPNTVSVSGQAVKVTLENGEPVVLYPVERYTAPPTSPTTNPTNNAGRAASAAPWLWVVAVYFSLHALLA